MKPALEIRRDDDGNIDEIFADCCTVHIERLDSDVFFVEITVNDGTNWRGRIEAGMSSTFDPQIILVAEGTIT